MGKDILSGNIVKPLVSMGTKAVEAVTKKGKELVQGINAHTQQEEVASQEASQGIASNVLGSVLYQQAQSKKSAGEVADTSETIEAENSHDQEVINETAEVMNNDDFPPPPLPQVDDNASLPPMPSPPPLPEDDFPLPPPPEDDNAFVTEYENIMQEADLDTKKSRLEQFFTPNNNNIKLTSKKIKLLENLLNNLKNNSDQKEITRVALKAFLQTPSQDNAFFKRQCNLAKAAVKNGILKPGVPKDKDIIAKFLQKPIAFPIQCELAEAAFQKGMLEADDEILKNLFSPSDNNFIRHNQYRTIFDMLKNADSDDSKKTFAKIALNIFLQNPSQDNVFFKRQCNLAKAAVENGILKADVPKDKDIIAKFLQKPIAFPIQCELAEAAVENGILKADVPKDKDVITKFLQNPSQDNDIFQIQCNLAKAAVENGILKADVPKDKDVITKFLQNPSQNYDIFQIQCNLAKAALQKGMLEADDEILKNLFSLSNNKIIGNIQCDTILNKMLSKINADSDDSKKTFAKIALNIFLQNPSQDNVFFKRQCNLAKKALQEGVLNQSDKNTITKFLQNPSQNYNSFQIQYNLAKAAVENGILKADVPKDKDVITKFLQNPSQNYDIFQIQCELAEVAFQKGMLEADDEILKKLFSPSDNNYIRYNQCDTINGMLSTINADSDDSKKTFAKIALNLFLQNPSQDNAFFKRECNLVKEAFKKGMLIVDYEILKKLFSPSDDKKIRNTQYDIIYDILTSLKDNSDQSQKDFVKVILNTFLQNPSQDNDIFKRQCNLAKAAVENGILKADVPKDKDVITKFLQNPSQNYDIFKSQCNLVEAAVENGILKADVPKDKDVITKFLQNPSQNYDIFKSQCNLVEETFQKGMLIVDYEILKKLFAPSNDKNIRDTQYDTICYILASLKDNSDQSQKDFVKVILNTSLQNPSQDNDIFQIQCNLAKNALQEGVLNQSDKNTITKFLQNPEDDNYTFSGQYDLAEEAFKKGMLIADDEILKKLFSPSDDKKIRDIQYNIISKRLTSLEDYSDKSQKDFVKVASNTFLQNPSQDNAFFQIQCKLAEEAFKKGMLIADDEILKKLFSPSDDENIRDTQYKIIFKILTSLKDNFDKSQKDFVKVASNTFLQNPSQDNAFFQIQCDLAEEALDQGVLKESDKETITKFLQKPNNYTTIKFWEKPNNDNFSDQCNLAKAAVKNGILKADVPKDKETITQFLQKPEDDNDTFSDQCKLAIEALQKGVLNESDKKTITQFLQKPKKPNNIYSAFSNQCELAIEALQKGVLNKSDKKTITKFLKKPNNDTFSDQCKLAQEALQKGVLNESYKYIITQFLQKPNYIVLSDQCELAIEALQKGVLNESDKDIITQFLQKPNYMYSAFSNQCELAKKALQKGILNESDKNIITPFLQKPNTQESALKAQFNLAKVAFEKCIQKEDYKILQSLFSPNDNKETMTRQYDFIEAMLKEKSSNDFVKVAFLAFLNKDAGNDKALVKMQCNLAKTAKNENIQLDEIQEFFDKVKNSILEQKITVAKNLSYLTNDQLKSIDEAKLLKDSENENKQFKLEYVLDLKISRGLYDNWEDLANVINKNAKILTPEDISNIYDDGVYNLTVIALKQMPLDKRDTFLSSIYKETNNPYLQELLTNEKKCDNEKLLTIRPVLKQYENKNVDDLYTKIPHNYRMPRTTDKCEVFEENGQRYLGYQGTSQRIKTDLKQNQIEYLFGEQRPSGNQTIGNCWLISELKHFNYDPELKLFIMSRFSMDKDGNVSITLKNNKKVTLPKDIVERATKTVNDENLSPAMACLSFLAALNRTREDIKIDILIDEDGIFNQDIIAEEDYLKQQFKKEDTWASTKSIKPLTDSQDPIFYALREYNESGNQYNDLLSLFFDKAENSDSNKEKFIIKSDLNTHGHAWSHYDDNLAANPQKSNTLFKKENVLPNLSLKDNAAFYSNTHYYVPKIDIKKHEFYS